MQNKTLVIAIIAISPFLLSAIICHYKGDVWEEKVRTVLYTLNRDTVPSFATDKIDANGIPFVYYAPQNGISAGTKYNATIVGNYAIDYYKQFSQSKDSAYLLKFKNCINWLLDNMVVNENYALYKFNWQQPWYIKVKAPFTSGMTSGRAIEAFTLAFTLYNDSFYLQKSKLLLRGFYLPIQNGGFTYKEKNGWWYEEVADSNLNTPRIIDGHIYAIQGVQKLWLLTREDSTWTIIKNGLEALKYNLPNYDAGNGIIYYDVDKKIADKKYQRILAEQMNQLYKTTGDPLFLQYHKKWISPMERTYVVRAFEEKNRSGIILYLGLTFLISTILFMIYKFAGKLKQLKKN